MAVRCQDSRSLNYPLPGVHPQGADKIRMVVESDEAFLKFVPGISCPMGLSANRRVAPPAGRLSVSGPRGWVVVDPYHTIERQPQTLT